MRGEDERELGKITRVVGGLADREWGRRAWTSPSTRPVLLVAPYLGHSQASARRDHLHSLHSPASNFPEKNPLRNHPLDLSLAS